MTIELVYRVRCDGPCRGWLSIPDDYQPGEDLPLAALEVRPTAARAGLWPDETAARRAAWAAGWSRGMCTDCGALEQEAPRREPHPTQADVDHAMAVLAKSQGRDTTESVCTNCKGSGLDPRHNGEFACPDCQPADEMQQDGAQS